MKLKFVYIYIVILLIVLFACKGFTNEKELGSNANKCTQYACPIHVDKTSTSLDRCPVCNEFMILAYDSLKKDSLKYSKK